MTEKFCSFSDDLREYLNTFSAPLLTGAETKDTPLRLADLVKMDAKEYVDKEGALKAIDFVQKEIQSISLSNELAELYKLEIDFLHDYKSIPQTKVIGRWLKDNKNDYFAKLGRSNP